MPHMRVRCHLDIHWFPFDEQLQASFLFELLIINFQCLYQSRCSIVFGSWSFTSNYLNYTIMSEDVSMKNFTDNQEWTLIGYKPTRLEVKYEHWFDESSFSEIKYKILIKRKALFVVQNYVIPAIFLCIMTLNSFFIPFPQGLTRFNSFISFYSNCFLIRKY